MIQICRVSAIDERSSDLPFDSLTTSARQGSPEASCLSLTIMYVASHGALLVANRSQSCLQKQSKSVKSCTGLSITPYHRQ